MFDNMSFPANGVGARLGTAFGTIVYLDETAGELRHGAIATSPANAVLATDRGPSAAAARGALCHLANGSPRPIACSAEGSWSTSGAAAPDGSLRLAEFAIGPLDGGLASLAAEGLYLCAEADGRVTHSRTQCGPWEQFRLVDADRGMAALADVAAWEQLRPEPVSSRYHLGCGGHFIPGYLNIDCSIAAEPDRVYPDFNGVSGAYFYNYDLSQGLPGADNSLDVIYHCHFLEHLSYANAIKLLRQARFRLKPGGIMRVLVPDLELWINNYGTDNTAFFDAYRRQALADDVKQYKTKGSIFMGMLHNFGHQCGYDWETLSWLLEDIGFTAIRRTLFQESEIAEMWLVEPYSPLRGMESLCIECRKPADPSAVSRDERCIR